MTSNELEFKITKILYDFYHWTFVVMSHVLRDVLNTRYCYCRDQVIFFHWAYSLEYLPEIRRHVRLRGCNAIKASIMQARWCGGCCCCI